MSIRILDYLDISRQFHRHGRRCQLRPLPAGADVATRKPV